MIADLQAHGDNVASAYWVVIPAYNEAPTVHDVAARAQQQCRNVIVVDDGSTDDTPAVLAGLKVTLLRNHDNLGKAGSLWRGFQYALAQGAAGVVTLDADGQHAPEEIPLLIAASLSNPEALVIGARRRDQRKTSFWRYAANRIADFWVGWAAGVHFQDSQSGFRLYPASLLRTIDVRTDKSRSFVFESEILIEAARKGVLCGHVPITVTPRSGLRSSHFLPMLDVLRITRMVAWKILSWGFYPKGLYACLLSFSGRHRVPLPQSRSNT